MHEKAAFMYGSADGPPSDEGRQRMPLRANLVDRQLFPVRLRLQRPKVIEDHIDRRHHEKRCDGGGDQSEGEAGGQRDQDVRL